MTKIGLGLAALGRPEYINVRENKDIDKSETAFLKNTVEVLDLAYKKGIRYFDTAPSYGKGEQFLKEWQEHTKHDDTNLATKWGYTYVANWQLGFDGSHEIKEHSLEKLVEQWHSSKKMLPALKVYQIHSATLESGVLENEAILQKLIAIKKETGLLIGLTSSGVHQNTILEKGASIHINGICVFDLFQVTYNVFEQNTFNMLTKLIKNDKKIVVKEGVANGRIYENTPPILTNLATKYAVGIDAIALRFIYDSLEPYVILSGAFSKKQLLENLKTLSFKLTKSEIDALKELNMDSVNYWNERKALHWD